MVNNIIYVVSTCLFTFLSTYNFLFTIYEAVPDSCCIRPREGCGRDIFRGHSLKKMAEYVKKIHVHGCLHAMEQVLKVN